MVRRAARKHTQMDVGTRGLCKSLKKIFDEFGLKIPDTRGQELRLDHAKRAPPQIDRGRRQSFIHWHEEITGTQDAPSAAERCVDRFTKCNSNIFDRVMLIHVKVARCTEPQVETAVTRHQFKHVIEEKNPRGNFGFAAAIEIQVQVDLRFLCIATYMCAPRHQRAWGPGPRIFRSFRNSAGVPIVMRAKPGPRSLLRARTRMLCRASLRKNARPALPKSASRKLAELGKTRTFRCASSLVSQSRRRLTSRTYRATVFRSSIAATLAARAAIFTG